MKAKYIDACIKTAPWEGEDSLAEMCSFAQKMGWQAVCVANTYEEKSSLKKQKNEVINARENSSIEIFLGVEINPHSPTQLKRLLKKARENVELVIVRSSDYAIIRAACEDSRVDVVLTPYLERDDAGIDVYCIRKAKENNIAFGISIRELFLTHKWERVEIFKNLTDMLKLCNEKNAQIIACTCAKSIFEVRAPRDIVGLLLALGAKQELAFAAVKDTPYAIIQKNLGILSGKYPVKGVEVL